jgi:serine/threonine-protein kinase HipA
MLVLARACGHTTAESRVVQVAGRDVLLVKRFDRERTQAGYSRARMISSLTLLRTEDTYQSRDKWSYVLLAEEVRRVCADPAQNATELFRRMCFNALISNTDDHPRNHALIAPTAQWELSPAYDLTPNPLTSLEKRDLAMTCGTFNRYANRINLLSQHAQFKLPLEQANAIIDQVQQVVAARWEAVLRQQGAMQADRDAVAAAFNYPGFELDPTQVLAAP